jgi:hypothetical protein
LTGPALALAVFALGSTGAAACDDDCDYCGGYGYVGYGYYAAPAYYGYYARPAYAYAPGPYYAAPAYAYYAPAYYAPSPAYYAPYYGYRSPYYGGRWGYVDAAAGRRKGVIPGVNPAPRGMYASGANPVHRAAKTLNASHVAPVAVKAPNPSHLAPAAAKAPKPSYDPRGVVAAPAKAPNPVARSISALAAHPSKPAGNLPVAAGYGAQGKYLPTAYYGGPGAYGSPRR